MESETEEEPPDENLDFDDIEAEAEAEMAALMGQQKHQEQTEAETAAEEEQALDIIDAAGAEVEDGMVALVAQQRHQEETGIEMKLDVDRVAVEEREDGDVIHVYDSDGQVLDRFEEAVIDRIKKVASHHVDAGDDVCRKMRRMLELSARIEESPADQPAELPNGESENE